MTKPIVPAFHWLTGKSVWGNLVVPGEQLLPEVALLPVPSSYMRISVQVFPQSAAPLSQ